MDSVISPIDPNKLPDTEKIINKVAAIRLRLKDPEIVELEKKDKLAHRLKLEKEFFDFFEKYPSLFKQVYQGGDLDMLAQMLCAIEKIKAKTISVKNAEKELGEQLAQKYLYDKVPKKQ